MTLKTTALAALLLAPALALADEEHDDKLCEVIGEAPNLSVPPKDRLWFKENCTCAGAAGCGKHGSKRLSQRLDAAAKALEAKKDAERAAREEAARKKKRKAAEEARLRVSVKERMKAVESSSERYGICLNMASRLAAPWRFCHDVEEEFIETPEGQAFYKAGVAREEAAAASARLAAEKMRDAELAQKDAEQLPRVRAACRAFHTCLELKRGSCAVERYEFELACYAAHFDATAPRASTSYPDYMCRNKAGPCD